MAEWGRWVRRVGEGQESLLTVSYVRDVRFPRSPDVGQLVCGDSQRPEPVVLVLTRGCDAEPDSVGELMARVGVPLLRLDADGLAEVELLADPSARLLLVDGRWFAPTVLWTRHFRAEAVEDVGAFGRSAWEQWAEQVGLCAALSVQGRGPGLGLLEQVRVAERLGIAVPRTVVATDPRRVAGLFGSARVVVKGLAGHFTEERPGELTGRFPAVMERGMLAAAGRPGPPVVVQEYVEHEAELRVYAVSGEAFAFEVVKAAPADPWLAPERVGVRGVEAPAAVAAAVRALTGAMGLRYAAFDFLMRGGVPVFLEANADGDWRWIEERAGTSVVTAAVARMLCELHRGVVAGRGGGVELITFLGGVRR
jgi:hypothetical protein